MNEMDGFLRQYNFPRPPIFLPRFGAWELFNEWIAVPLFDASRVCMYSMESYTILRTYCSHTGQQRTMLTSTYSLVSSHMRIEGCIAWKTRKRRGRDRGSERGWAFHSSIIHVYIYVIPIISFHIYHIRKLNFILPESKWIWNISSPEFRESSSSLSIWTPTYRYVLRTEYPRKIYS